MTVAEAQRLTMTRRFDASPERLFDAWTDPRLAHGWLFTTPDSEAHSAEIDLRIGGAWKIVDRRGGTDYTALGEYLEIDRPRRLAFSFGMPQFSPAFDKVTVEIAADGDGAIMTLTQEGLPPAYIPATEDGWAKMFDALSVQLAD
ncbi:MAG TPA: SRPBCC domain-containing protein [Caulobacteraceae bacterium]|nr:SRPBCC domain-containing protein [Caulobacteraceae bacterium]